MAHSVRTYIREITFDDHLSLDGLAKSAHEIRTGKVPYLVHVDHLGNETIEQLDTPMDVVVKGLKSGSRDSADWEVRLSSIMSIALAENTCQVLAYHPQGAQIEGVVARRMNILPFAEMYKYKTDGTPVTVFDIKPEMYDSRLFKDNRGNHLSLPEANKVLNQLDRATLYNMLKPSVKTISREDIDLESLAEILTPAYIYGEDDLHGRNLVIVLAPLPNGKFKAAKIDHDSSMHRLTRQMKECMRFLRFGDDYRFRVSEEDLEKFPILDHENGAKIHYWPTRRATGKPGDDKRYTNEDVAFFKSIATNETFIKWKYGSFIKNLLIPSEALRNEIASGSFIQNPGRDQMLIDAVNLRKAVIKSALFSLKSFRETVAKHKKEYVKKYAEQLGYFPGFLEQKIDEILEEAATVKDGDTPLHNAVRFGWRADETLEHFNQHTNAVNCRGETPMHYAAIVGNLRAVIHLFTAGANPNAHTYNSDTPLQFAVLFGKASVVEFLVKHATLDDSDVDLLIDIAISKKHYDIALMLNQHFDRARQFNIDAQSLVNFEQPQMLQHVLQNTSQRIIPFVGPLSTPNKLICQWLINDRATNTTTVEHYLTNEQLFEALTSYVKIKDSTLTESHSALQSINRSNITYLMQKALQNTHKSGLFSLLAAVNKQLDQNGAEELLVTAMKGALDDIRDTTHLSLAERKMATLRCYESIAPYITLAKNFHRLVDMATDNKNLYLRQHTSKLWIIRYLRGGVIGVTTTFKSIFNLMYNRAYELRATENGTAFNNMEKAYAENITGFFGLVTRTRKADVVKIKPIELTQKIIERNGISKAQPQFLPPPSQSGSAQYQIGFFAQPNDLQKPLLPNAVTTTELTSPRDLSRPTSQHNSPTISPMNSPASSPLTQRRQATTAPDSSNTQNSFFRTPPNNIQQQLEPFQQQDFLKNILPNTA